MTLLLNEEIRFPQWNEALGLKPYVTYIMLADALKYGRSLDAAMRAADDEELLIDNDDVFTRKLLLKAVDLRRGRRRAIYGRAGGGSEPRVGDY